jgi:hypothetical protein
MTGGLGLCRVQRLAAAQGEPTWTVVGQDHRVVEPAEEYLEYLRARQMSPNTVKSRHERTLAALCRRV